MLDTKRFLARVFAQRDELVICTHKPDPTGVNPRGIFWNRGSYTSIDDAIIDIERWDREQNTTIYFGVGSFAGHSYVADNGRTKWQRKQSQATWFKALALDLDIGPDKPYATQRDGWQAMHGALKQIGLPQPMVISSGRGIHCYWPLTEPVSTSHWVRASVALRVALEQHGVVIDTSKIHDPSMVLRPVGTHHKKQTPWKLVECKADCPDYDPVALFTVLKPWISAAPAATQPARRAPGKSSIMAAVMNSNDVVLDAVAKQCAQVRALVDSGGVIDAAGNPVAEPLWRASLGLAKHCVDVTEAVIRIAGKHPDFDLDANLSKIDGWHGTGPTTCAKFEQLCAGGCEGCPQRGKIKSPAQLTASTTDTVELPTGDLIDLPLPRGYVLRQNGICKEVQTEITTTDANGNDVAATVTEYDFISAYPMHITGVYNDPVSKKSAFRLAIKYPMVGWREEDHEIPVLASVGKEFSAFLLNRQVYVKTVGQQDKLRGYLMDYLTMVQSMAPSGMDYVSFGWQADGSFLCGERVIGAPTGHTDTRLRGPAARFAGIIAPHGSRDEWIKGMAMLKEPGTQTIRSAVLLATAGLLGPAAGNASMVVSIYSTETTTGKTLALIAANSLIGSPRELFLNKNDTANALFKVRGTLNNLPCAIDELTAADEADVVDLAYDLSQGREKIAMTRDRELKEPARWDGPTLITTNISLHQKFDMVQTNNDPLKARTLELHHHDRTFITTDSTGSSNGYRFFDIMAENNGWALPEIAEAIIAMGGPKVVWEKGLKAFSRHFNFHFEPQERFFRTGIIAGWIACTIGKKLGLFPFNVDATARYLLDCVADFRVAQQAEKLDVFDTIGQFLQEHNDEIVVVDEVYGSGAEVVTGMAPLRAVARMKVVKDNLNPVMPGSQLAINITALRKWLSKSRDGVERITRELAAAGALISPRDRVTLFKGCQSRNPGQAHCVIINLNHQRFIEALTAPGARKTSPVALAILKGVGQ